MSNKLRFAVEDAEIIDENPESQFAKARILAFSSEKNRHNMVCSEEVLKKTAPTIYNKPILYTYDELFDDFGTHAEPENTRIAGFVYPDSAEFVTDKDGRIGLSVLTAIWKRYAPKAISLFKRDKGKKKVSVEMELLDYRDNPDGTTDMLDFAYTGISILGDLITEASQGANIQVLSFSDEKKQYDEDYNKEFAFKYDGIDFTIPDEIKANAQKGLELSKSSGKGNSLALSIARYLSSNKEISPERVRQIHKFFKRNRRKDEEPEEVKLLWGGKDAISWSESLFKFMEEKDETAMAYYSKTVTFPYTKREDIPPSLRGIDPPITPEQASEIARQAEGIGSDDEKNGWAIAVANFKKRHKVVDGRWVKMGDAPGFAKENSENEDSLKVNTNETALVSSINAEHGGIDANKESERKRMSMEDEKEKDEALKKEEEKETPEEEKGETPEKEKEEKEKGIEKKLSLDAYLDVAATLAMLEEETEDREESVMMACDELKKGAEFADSGKVCAGLYAKACKMSSALKASLAKMAEIEEREKAYMAEVEELKKFKSDVEKQRFEFEVDTTLKEVENAVNMPKEEMSALKEKSAEFSMDNIEAWKNLVKARAFSFAAKKTDNVVKYGLPFAPSAEKVVNSPWKSK